MSGQEATPLDAANPFASAWVSANAGSGKTHTLANRVTRLLLADVDPAKILCLTYTKAAAAEMQERLFNRLGQWSMFDDGKLSAEIAKIGARAESRADLRKARRLFARALETPGGLKIQTIHAFCQNVLSRFPLEAGISPGFRVLDEQTARDLLNSARVQVLERAGRGDARLAEAAAYIATQISENRLSVVLSAALGNDRAKLERFFDRLPAGPDALRNAINRAHGADGARPETIAQQFCAEIKADDSRLSDVVAWLETGGTADRRCAAALKRALVATDAEAMFAGICDALLKGDGEPYASTATKPLQTKRPDLFEYLSGLTERLYAASQRYKAARAAALAEAAVTLAAAAHETYTAEKRARGYLDYDDLIAGTLRLLERQAAAQWVLYKLDGGIDHILIDEAQDTSPDQWRIVRKLTEEFFAGEGATAGRARTVFAVGDEKQSIFSFQGAEPVQFEYYRQFFGAHAKPFADVPLLESRRSAPEILSFVDRVFQDETARAGLTPDAREILHVPHRKDAKGWVEFWPALKPDAEKEHDPWRPVDVPSENSPVVRLARQIAAQIAGWMEKKLRLPGHDRPIAPQDIMILLPRRQPFASEIIRRLKEYGVPVAGGDRIRLTEQMAVMDLIALGRFVLLPEDDLNLAALMRSPILGFSEQELFELAGTRKGHLWRALAERRDERPCYAAAHDFLTGALTRADLVPPHEFFSSALSRGCRKKLLSRLGPEAADAIDEFLSLALAFEAMNTPSLEGFLHWIERGEAEVKRDMERSRNEVRVMTVHGAKGLDADIVILPDTTTLPDPPGKRGELLFAGDDVIFTLSTAEAPEAVKRAKERAKAEALKEHKRLLYVALTRAKDRLCICGFENKRGVARDSWYELAERATKACGREIVRDGKTLFAFGAADLEPHTGAVAAADGATELPAWAQSMPGPEPETPRLIRPFDAADATDIVSSPLSEGSARRFRRGILIHALLAGLPQAEPGRREAMARKFLAAHHVPDGDIDALVAETLKVLNHPVFAPAFGENSRAEVSVIADLPHIGEGARVSGRIDRLAVSDGEVLIVDFKTNRPPPTKTDDVPQLYRAQMALYREALAKIYPGRRIVAALVWTDGPGLMPLPDAMLDAEIGHIRARLDSGASRS